MVESPTIAITNKPVPILQSHPNDTTLFLYSPTHLTLTDNPSEIPVIIRGYHHVNVNGLTRNYVRKKIKNGK
jgi:hypothetical protein